MAQEKTKVVIVGNGFGGIYTLKYLHKLIHRDHNAELYLIGDKNYFLFTPLLHEVATGGLYESSVVEPVRKLMPCCLHKFYLGTAEFVDTKARTVRSGDRTIPYDYLILATGAETNFYNVPGAEENCFTLKSIPDAIAIKNHIIREVERAAHTADTERKKKMLRFVVVGGGPTGVELMAEIAELVKETFGRYYTCGVLEYVSLLLVERGKELASQFNPKIRAKSLEVLKNKGVEVMLESAVEEVGPDHILVNGRRIETEAVIWVAGIKPRVPAFDIEPQKSKDGRLLVDKFLVLPEKENIFALGDVAAFPDNGSFLPALAQVATKEARAVAVNVARKLQNLPLKEFRYRQSGLLLSLGQWMAAGEIKGMTIYGRFAWWLWRTVYLFKFASWRKKLLVAIDWTIGLFQPRDISEL